MKQLFIGSATILVFAFIASAQQSLPEEIAFTIKREAFQNSQIQAMAYYLTDFVGPRLAASKLGERGEVLAKDKLAELGFSDARIEYATDFPRGGWDNIKTYAAMTAPYYCNFMATPKAWSGSTNGLVKGEVILLDINTLADIDKYKGKLADKIVLMPEVSRYEMRFTPFATRHSDEDLNRLATDHRTQEQLPASVSSGGLSMEIQLRIRALLAEEKPAIIVSGAGSFNVPRSQSVAYRSGDPEPVAELVLPIENHGRMVRMIANEVAVSMEIEIKNEFYDNQVINNVIAEIPGNDPKLKDEIVLIGGHLDSWHGGTGAADNASGCVVMMEALRIIKESGIKPRRTIRIALWGGEELGLIGSRAYMQNFLYDVDENKPKKGYEQFALYLNMDNGAGKFRGIYLEENDMAFPFFQAWIKTLGASMDFGVLSPRRTGGTDHLSFDRIGLPAFQFIQDALEYGRGYHTPMDTYERLSITDLQYNAAIVAWLALSAAMDNNKIPPKPLPTGFSMQQR